MDTPIEDLSGWIDPQGVWLPYLGSHCRTMLHYYPDVLPHHATDLGFIWLNYHRKILYAELHYSRIEFFKQWVERNASPFLPTVSMTIYGERRIRELWLDLTV